MSKLNKSFLLHRFRTTLFPNYINGARSNNILSFQRLPLRFFSSSDSSTTQFIAPDTSDKKKTNLGASFILDEWTDDSVQEIKPEDVKLESEAEAIESMSQNLNSNTDQSNLTDAFNATSTGTSASEISDNHKIPTGVPMPKLSKTQISGKSIHMKRFYEKVEVQKVTDELSESESSNKMPGNYHIVLDGRVMKTPDKNELLIPSKEIAECIRHEWDKQEKEILPDTMPYHSLLCTAIDQVLGNENEWIEKLIPFLETDTVCFPGCGASDQASFMKKQEELWTPVRERFAKKHDVEIVVAEGICMPDQPEETLEKIRSYLDPTITANKNLNFYQLTALEIAVQQLKSLIVGMELVTATGEMTVSDAISTAYLEEEHQMSFWGEDPSWVEKKKSLELWLGACKKFSDYMSDEKILKL